MASVQCCKPADQHTMCNQTQQQPHQSLGQKVTQVVNSVFKKDHTNTTTTTTTTSHGQCPIITENNGTQCHGNGKSSGRRRNNNGEARKKRGLIQKMKDGLSGHSDTSSSSESDSDDDNNKCATNKN